MKYRPPTMRIFLLRRCTAVALALAAAATRASLAALNTERSPA